MKLSEVMQKSNQSAKLKLSDVMSDKTVAPPKPSFRTEVMGPITHAASALAFDVPRTTMEMQRLRGEPGAEQAKEFLYPEQQTLPGKILRFGLEAPATVLGGAGQLATKTFTKMAPVAAKGMLGKVAQGAASGATYGALQTKPTAREYGESLLQTTAGGAVLPVAGKAISKVGPAISGFGKTVVSKGAGLSKTAMDTVSRLGFKKVREIADKGVNYIQEDVIPRARQSLIKNITSAGEASKELLQDMGFNPDQIKSVMKISKQNMNKYGKMVSESWVKTEENLGKALTNVGKQIGDVYAKASKEGQKINIKNTIGTMRKQLRGLGVVDDVGNLLGDYKTHPSSAVRNLAQIYSEYAPRIGKGDISVPDFLNFRTRLQASIVKFPEGEKFNVPIYITNKVLKEDSINSLIQKGSPYEKFWRNLNKEYSDLETLDYLTKKITTVANNLPNKILTQRNKLTDKHMKLYGKDIVNDVDAYNAARELYPEKETIGLFNIQKPAIREVFKRTEALKEAIRPATAPIGRIVQKAGQFGANRLQQYMETPLVSPKTKSFFVQAPGQVGAKLKGKSGQAVFGREEPQKPVFGVKPQESTPTHIQKPIAQPGAIPQGKQGIGKPQPQEISHPSRIYKVLAQNPQETWTPQQLRGFLSGKVSQNELDTLLTPELMAKPKITKADVLQSIEKNMPQTEVVRKSEKATEVLNEYNKYAQSLIDKYQKQHPGYNLSSLVQDNILTKAELTQLDSLNNAIKTHRSESTKFSQWQLPSGSNYQETLIKAPASGGKKYTQLNSITKEIFNKNYDNLTEAKDRVIVKREYAKRYGEFGTEPEREANLFKSSHFDEPNVLAHVRHNDRVTPQGEKVRFLEEIQSDWAQKARKGEAPEHPLTKNWQELTLKQALKDAAESDAKYLSWTTGEQQAGRYDLSKQVDSINWFETAWVDRKSVQIKIKNQQPMSLWIDSNWLWIDSKGKVTSAATTRGGEEVIGKNITEIIGKDHAEKIVSQPKGNLSGENLKIGGEWAKNLYDKQIPNILKKLTGKDVEMIKIGQPSETFQKIGREGSYATKEKVEMLQPAIRLTPELKAQIKSGKGKIGELFGLAGLTAAGTLMAGQAQADEKKNVLEGEVSTYGWDAKKEHLNERTANNEKFDPNGLTAAMWDIPFGTKVKVTDKKTGKTVIVRINDRGPARRLNRPIDLSRGAWKALGYEKPGLIQAKIEILKTD